MKLGFGCGRFLFAQAILLHLLGAGVAGADPRDTPDEQCYKLLDPSEAQRPATQILFGDDHLAFQKVGSKLGMRLVQFITPPKRASEPRRFEEDSVAKAEILKNCKTVVASPNPLVLGYVRCAREDFESDAAWERKIAMLKAKKYTFDENWIAYDANGRPSFSDYDLLGIYNLDERNSEGYLKPAFSEQYQNAINELLKKHLVVHGPLDDWPFRETQTKGGDIAYDYEKFPILAVIDGQPPLAIYNARELWDLYRQLNIKWPWRSRPAGVGMGAGESLDEGAEAASATAQDHR